MTASDVIHSWWIPKLGGKVDGVPGHVNETWFKIPADKAGTVFRGQCAELCGAGHADMRAAGAGGDPGRVRGLGGADAQGHPGSRARTSPSSAQRREGEPVRQ